MEKVLCRGFVKSNTFQIGLEIKLPGTIIIEDCQRFCCGVLEDGFKSSCEQSIILGSSTRPYVHILCTDVHRICKAAIKSCRQAGVGP